MINQQLLDYIKQSLDGGETKENIKNKLLSAGWQDNDIEEAFNFLVPSVKPIKSSKKNLLVLIMAIFVLLGSGFVYAYIQKIGPFSLPKYSEDNFLSSLLEKTSQIKSSSYAVSGALEVVLRDANAEPFTLKEASNAAELKQKYYNDYERLKNSSSIVSRLNILSNYNTYSSMGLVVKPYPANIKKIFNNISSGSIVDPVTKKEYEYQATEGGKNFLLTVNFETDYAIKEITTGYLSPYKATSTIIVGRKVSFTKDSSSLYMSSEPPKPFLVTLGDELKNLPSDINIKSAISASYETKTEGVGGWLFNIDAEGDFGGDLTYKVNIDALKKDDYYFKINNFPSLFLFGDLSYVKGKWIKISSQEASSTNKTSYSPLSSFSDKIPNMEKSYKENSEKAFKFIKKVVTIADEEKLVAFKNKPQAEKVDGRQLIKYELTLRKEAILPFYAKLQDEINKDPDFSNFRSMIDQGLIDYLKSEEFEQVFTYLNNNNSFVFWTDDKGFPAIVQNTTRIVPPDTAAQLKGKQIDIVFKVIISDINKTLDIKVPSDAVPIEEIIKDLEKNS